MLAVVLPSIYALTALAWFFRRPVNGTSSEAGGGEDEDGECPVCLGEFETEEPTYVCQTCMNRFHANCFALQQTEELTCPMCRAPEPHGFSRGDFQAASGPSYRSMGALGIAVALVYILGWEFPCFLFQELLRIPGLLYAYVEAAAGLVHSALLYACNVAIDGATLVARAIDRAVTRSLDTVYFLGFIACVAMYEQLRRAARWIYARILAPLGYAIGAVLAGIERGLTALVFGSLYLIKLAALAVYDATVAVAQAIHLVVVTVARHVGWLVSETYSLILRPLAIAIAQLVYNILIVPTIRAAETIERLVLAAVRLAVGTLAACANFAVNSIFRPSVACSRAAASSLGRAAVAVGRAVVTGLVQPLGRAAVALARLIFATFDALLDAFCLAIHLVTDHVIVPLLEALWSAVKFATSTLASAVKAVASAGHASCSAVYARVLVPACRFLVFSLAVPFAHGVATAVVEVLTAVWDTLCWIGARLVDVFHHARLGALALLIRLGYCGRTMAAVVFYYLVMPVLYAFRAVAAFLFTRIVWPVVVAAQRLAMYAAFVVHDVLFFAYRKVVAAVPYITDALLTVLLTTIDVADYVWTTAKRVVGACVGALVAAVTWVRLAFVRSWLAFTTWWAQPSPAWVRRTIAAVRAVPGIIRRAYAVVKLRAIAVRDTVRRVILAPIVAVARAAFARVHAVAAVVRAAGAAAATAMRARATAVAAFARARGRDMAAAARAVAQRVRAAAAHMRERAAAATHAVRTTAVRMRNDMAERMRRLRRAAGQYRRDFFVWLHQVRNWVNHGPAPVADDPLPDEHVAGPSAGPSAGAIPPPVKCT